LTLTPNFVEVEGASVGDEDGDGVQLGVDDGSDDSSEEGTLQIAWF